MSYAASESTSGPVTFGAKETSLVPILLVAVGILAAWLLVARLNRK